MNHNVVQPTHFYPPKGTFSIVWPHSYEPLYLNRFTLECYKSLPWFLLPDLRLTESLKEKQKGKSMHKSVKNCKGH